MRTIEQIEAELKVARLEVDLAEARGANRSASIDSGGHWGCTGRYETDEEYAISVRAQYLITKRAAPDGILR